MQTRTNANLSGMNKSAAILMVMMAIIFCASALFAQTETIKLIGQYSGLCSTIAVKNNIAYIGEGYNLSVFDVSSPAYPQRLGTVAMPDSPNGDPDLINKIAVSGNYAYVANADMGLVIVSIANPYNPFIVGRFNTSGYATGVFVKDKYAYVADGDAGVAILNISNPAQPRLVGVFNDRAIIDYAFSIHVFGALAFVANAEKGVLILDVSNPSQPIYVNDFDTAGFTQDVFAGGNVLYVADGSTTKGLQILDISRLEQIELLGSVDTPGNSIGLAFSNPMIYMANGNAGLQIYDVSAQYQAHPLLRGSYDTDGTAYEVALEKDRIYLADLKGGFKIFQFTATQIPTPTPTPEPTATPTPTPFYGATLATGRILDTQSGKPVNGATVQIDGGILKVFSDAQGNYYLYGVDEGAHKLQVWGFAYEFKEINISVVKDQITNVPAISLGKIRGTVVGRLVDDQTGEPLINARVQLDYNMAGGTMTDEDGQFMLIFVAPGLHRLQSWRYAYTFQEQIIDVNSYAVTDIGELRFSMIADAVRGQVADANSGRPIEGAVVQYDGGAEGKRVYTDANGRYILVNVPQGEHQLQVWGLAYGYTESEFIHIAGTSEDLGKTILSPIGNTVSGRLVDSVNGLPVYNATVQLDGGAQLEWNGASGRNGDFILYNVTPEIHYFQTWGYAYRFLERQIKPASGQNIYLGEVALTPDPNTFNGRIIEAQTRLPLGGASIVLYGKNSTRAATSFPDGRFVLINLPEGVYGLKVEMPTHETLYFRAIHAGGDKNIQLGDVPIVKKFY